MTIQDDKKREEDAETCKTVTEEFNAITATRYNFENLWEDTTSLIMPEYRGTIRTNSVWTPGIYRGELQYDSNAPMALNKFTSIVDSLVTPRGQKYHAIVPEDDQLLKSRRVMEYCEQVTNMLFRYRYRTRANFASQNSMNFRMSGVFGNCSMFIDKIDNHGEKGFMYKSLPIGEIYFAENHQGITDKMVRPMWYTGRQICQKWPKTVPSEFEQKCKQLKSFAETYFRVYHMVRPRADYNPGMITERGQKFESIYVLECEKIVLQRGGYRVFPYANHRYVQEPGEVFGRGPAMLILSTIKTINAQKKAMLKQAHRTLDPVLLAHDDGVIDDFSLRPGSVNRGGVNADGKPLVHTLPTGNIQVGHESMALEKAIIDDAFLVDMFNILRERPQMTATEVIELTKEKGYLMAPILGRYHTEYLEPMVERELDLLDQMGLLPEMPPELTEQGGFEYALRFDSPLSRASRAEEVSGVMSSISATLEIVNATQDPSPLDRFDMDKIVPAIANIQGVPIDWIRSDDAVAAIRKQRAEAQERAAQADEAPGAAAVLTAAAKARQAGLNLNQPGAEAQ